MKFRVRLERLGLDYDNFEAVYGEANAPCTSGSTFSFGVRIFHIPAFSVEASASSEDRKKKAREGYMSLANVSTTK